MFMHVKSWGWKWWKQRKSDMLKHVCTLSCLLHRLTLTHFWHNTCWKDEFTTGLSILASYTVFKLQCKEGHLWIDEGKTLSLTFFDIFWPQVLSHDTLQFSSDLHCPWEKIYTHSLTHHIHRLNPEDATLAPIRANHIWQVDIRTGDWTTVILTLPLIHSHLSPLMSCCLWLRQSLSIVAISSLCCWMIFFRAPSSSCCCFCRNSCSWRAREKRSSEQRGSREGRGDRGTAESRERRHNNSDNNNNKNQTYLLRV